MFPQLREWIGPRVVNNLKAHRFTIENRKFELTVSVSRTDLEDDRLGVFKPVFAQIGQLARRHPEERLFGLLKAGFATACFDGQNFFDSDHPVEGADGAVTSVSNMQTGSEPAWFLLDVSQAVRPIIWQKRQDYEFQQGNRDDEEYVFKNDEYLYGVRARVNAGFGLWQLAFGSQDTLDETNYAAARAAMMGAKADGGRLFGARPTVLVVPPELESDALYLLNTETKDGGGSNPWKGTAELIVTSYAAG